MKSGETAGHGNGPPHTPTARQAKRAGTKLEAGPEASAERSEGTMEARQGRDAAGGSMRSTTARPAISQVAGDARTSVFDMHRPLGRQPPYPERGVHAGDPSSLPQGTAKTQNVTNKTY